MLDYPRAAVAETVAECDLFQCSGVRALLAQAEMRRDRHFMEQVESHGRWTVAVLPPYDASPFALASTRRRAPSGQG